MILHSLKNYDAVARRFDLVAKYFELGADPKRGDLAFYEALGTLRQRLLHFADTDRQHTPLAKAIFNRQLGKKVRFARTPSAMRALIARGLQQRLKDARRLKLKSSGRQ
jgi:hypothetical protein